MDTVASHMGPSKTRSDGFRKIAPCLYRYENNGKYFAFIRHQGKLTKQCLKASTLAHAKRELNEVRSKLERVDLKAGKITLSALCTEYLKGLKEAPKTAEGKAAIVERLKKDWPDPKRAEVQVSAIKPSDVRKWLASYSFGPASYNAYLWFIRGAFDHAVENRMLATNPASGIRAMKRDAPIRTTPTFDQFKSIVSGIRSQSKNARHKESADFVEFMGLAGVGNAETINLTWGDIDFESGTITLFRQKTRKGYKIPLFPQLRPLLEARRGNVERRTDEPVFTIRSAKKSMKATCEKLNLPPFDHRSLRRMFVTRALQLGVDVKTVSAWQGHQDGGKLILSTYSHVLNDHSERMAKLITES